MKSQRGMTLIGTLLVACFVGFIGFLALKITPVYLQHFSVVSSMKALNKLPESELTGAPSQVAYTLHRKLQNQLYVNGIHFIKPKDIKIKTLRQGYEVSIKYEAKQPLFANIALLFHFDNTEQVVIRGRQL